jgi:hypothetical protein
MGLLWGGAFALAGGVFARLPNADWDVPLPILLTPLGVVSGVFFSGALVALSRRRQVHGMSVPRFGAWGAASGGLLSSLILGGAALRGETLHASALVFGIALTTASAVCAAGSLALARRGDARELAAGEAAELSVEERRALLP